MINFIMYFSMLYMKKKKIYYVIGGPYVSDQAGLNRGPLILIVFHCYFVSTFCEDRINTFLILILILYFGGTWCISVYFGVHTDPRSTSTR